MHNPFSKIFGNSLAGIVVVSLLGAMNPTHADICVKGLNKVVSGKVIASLSKVTRSGRCKKGEVAAITGPTGATGAVGATGPAGADGQLRIYGDSSGGAKTVTANETFSDPIAMYTDVVINSGVTVTVPSGTVVRCSGSFVNNGTIVVQTGAPGGIASSDSTTTVRPLLTPAHPGISARSPSSGESGNSSTGRFSGEGGVGLSQFQAALLRYPGPFAGGGGAGGFFVGGAGGGSLVVLCAGGITNNGIIRADGGNGSGSGINGGGGGGGVVILASKTAVVSSATSQLLARGGNGGGSGASSGSSGGGGGGIIHLIAPDVNATGATVSVAGGSAGIISTVEMSLIFRSAGHGGGASGGSGGEGGFVSGSDTASSPAFPGQTGEIIYTVADPTSLF